MVMDQLRRPRILLLAALAVLVLAAFVMLSNGGDESSTARPIAARVKSGDFRVIVTTTGELRARKAVQIQGPPNMQAAQVYQTRISSLVAEATVVKAGRPVPGPGPGPPAAP